MGTPVANLAGESLVISVSRKNLWKTNSDA